MSCHFCSYKGVLCICHQSPTRLSIRDGTHEVLYCVASRHSFEYKYQWNNNLGPVGVNVFETGTYQCTVTSGVGTVTSKPILVTVTRGRK